MSDDRPEPRYGQYAPVPPPATEIPPAPPANETAVPLPPPAGARADAPRRRWDVVLTTLLLLFGVYDVVTGFGTYADLSAPLRAVFEQQGIGDFTSDALALQLGIWLNVLRVALLAAAIVVSLLRISRNRIAFWAPLGAGVLAVLATLVAAGVLVVSDPAFTAYLESMQ
ncbi:MAG: hypothetical protein JWP85_58 [Rhodoglobus sp.]|nr:hypothetical protein [Rhodoglobus sp.]